MSLDNDQQNTEVKLDEQSNTEVKLDRRYITLNARGTLIDVPYEIAKKSPVLLAYIERWNTKNEPYVINYSADIVHKMLDRLNNVSIEEFLCIADVKHSETFWDVVSKVDGNIKSIFTKEDVSVPPDCAKYTRGNNSGTIVGIVSVGKSIKKITITFMYMYGYPTYFYIIDKIFIYDLWTNIDSSKHTIEPIICESLNRVTKKYTKICDASNIIYEFIVDNLNDPEIISRFYPV